MILDFTFLMMKPKAMKILIASDSFKGCMSSAEVAKNITTGILRVFSDAKIEVLTIADGGEGTALVLTEVLGGQLHRKRVFGPMANPVDAVFGILPGGEAIMDMASASGITLVPEGKTNIMSATTFGTGQMILAALDHGCRRIYLGIGGSATNDGGLGMASALGVRFLDEHGKSLCGEISCDIEPMDDSQLPRDFFLGGKDLLKVAKIDISNIDHRIVSTNFFILSDVTNPLCGSTGAAHTYGAQKGATPEDIELLDRGLSHFAEVVKRDIGLDLAEMDGIGAAGGLGLSLIAFMGAKMLRGIDYILDAIGFDEKACQSDLIITGEGRIDPQSAYGKVISGIAIRGAKLGVPVIAIGGAIDGDIQELYNAGVCSVEAAVSHPMTLDEAMKNGADNLVLATERIMQAIELGMRLATGMDK